MQVYLSLKKGESPPPITTFVKSVLIKIEFQDMLLLEALMTHSALPRLPCALLAHWVSAFMYDDADNILVASLTN